MHVRHMLVRNSEVIVNTGPHIGLLQNLDSGFWFRPYVNKT